jgi:hypothetical protein
MYISLRDALKMMAFSVLALRLLDHQMLVAKIADVGKLSLSSSVSNISISGFILFQKHVFSQILVIALMKWLFFYNISVPDSVLLLSLDS